LNLHDFEVWKRLPVNHSTSIFSFNKF
jgi:hypothetical protein